MTEYSKNTNVYVKPDTRAVRVSRDFGLREVWDVAVSLADGSDFPAGTYLILLIYNNQIVASGSDVTISDGALTAEMSCNTVEAIEAFENAGNPKTLQPLFVVWQSGAAATLWACDTVRMVYAPYDGQPEPTEGEPDYVTVEEMNLAIAAAGGHTHDQTPTATAPADTDMVLARSAAGTYLRYAWSTLKTALGHLFAAKAHKAQHATGGTDALVASDIGAVALSLATTAGDSMRATGNAAFERVPAATAANITGAATPAVKARSYTTWTLTGAVSSLAPTGLEPGEMIAGRIVNASGYTMPDLSANAYPGWTTTDAATDGAGFILVNVAGTLKWGFAAP